MAAGTLVALTGDNHPDTMLHALLLDFLENGAKALEHLDGHFALVIYIGGEESLFVISDPMGHFSIFYGDRGDQTIFSTSALAVARQINSLSDELTLESFLRSGKVHGDKTFWRDVHRVLPGTLRKICQDKIEEYEYWAPTYDETIAHLTFENALEHAVSMLTRIFTRLLQREGKVWADLTGGFDTRVTTMLMAKIGIPFTAYCVGPDDHPDVQISQLICQEMGWEYQHMPMPDNWHHEQLNWLEAALQKGDARLSVSGLASVLYGQQLRSAIYKVNVGGLGADEWREAAYLSTYLCNWGKTYAYCRLVDAGILSSIPPSILRMDREKLVRDELIAYIAKVASSYSEFPNVIKGNAMFINYRYPSHGGAYMSATAGIIRALNPVCFKESVNFALSLNYKWRLNYHYRFVRALLERENPHLANIETAKGGPAIPMRVTNLRKFWPLWKPILNRNVKKFSYRLFGRPVKLWEQPHYAEYPLPSWRTSLLNHARSEGLLNPSEMHSGALYNAKVLHTLVGQAERNHSEHSEFLDRVITIEMALRAVGTGID